jgi:hypothetical protein
MLARTPRVKCFAPYNDEVERQAGALPLVEAALSHSSIPSYNKRRCTAQSVRTIS